jgi:hypothetical protein
MAMQGPTRTVGQLFRDCIRLVNHIAGKSAKGDNLRKIVGNEFRKNAGLKDPDQIASHKGNAMRALSNYLMLESLSKDKKFKEKASSYNDRELKSVAHEEAAEKKFEDDYDKALEAKKKEEEGRQ